VIARERVIAVIGKSSRALIVVVGAALIMND